MKCNDMRRIPPLDAEMERLLMDKVHHTKRKLKDVVDDAVRFASAPEPSGMTGLREPAAMRLRAEIDPFRMNDMEGDLEAKAFMETTVRLLETRR